MVISVYDGLDTGSAFCVALSKLVEHVMGESVEVTSPNGPTSMNLRKSQSDNTKCLNIVKELPNGFNDGDAIDFRVIRQGVSGDLDCLSIVLLDGDSLDDLEGFPDEYKKDIKDGLGVTADSVSPVKEDGATEEETNSSDVDGLLKEIEELKSELEELKSNPLVDESVVNELKSQLTELSKELEESKNTVITLTNDNESLNSAIESLEEELALARENVDEAMGSDDIVSIDFSGDDDFEKIDELELEIVRLKAEVVRLNKESGGGSSATDDNSKEIDGYKATIDGLNSDIAKLRTEISNLTEQLNSKEATVVTVGDEGMLSEQLRLSEQMVATLKNSVERYRANGDTLKDEVAKLKLEAADVHTVKADIVVKEKRIEGLTEEVSKLTEDIKVIPGLNEEITKLKGIADTVPSLDSKIASLTNENSDLLITKGVYESLKVEHNELKDTLSKSEGTVKSLESEVGKLTVTNTGKDNELFLLKDEVNRLQDEHKDATSEVSRLEVTIESLNSKLKELSDMQVERASGVDHEMLDDLNTKISNLEVELTAKNTELDLKVKNISELTETIATLTADLDETKSNLEGMVSADYVSTSNEELDELRKELGIKEEEANELREALAEADSKPIDTTALDSLTEENNSLKSKLKELEIRSSEVTAKEEELNSDILNARDTIEKLESDVREREEKILELNNDLALVGMSDEDLLMANRKLEEKLLRANASPLTKVVSGVGSREAFTEYLSPTSKHFNKCAFVFSGHSEARKSTYKVLKGYTDKISASGKRVLILDLNAEGGIDYEYGLKSVVDGSKYFVLESTLAECVTKGKGVDVLSCGMGYVNDGFFLDIAWIPLLEELNNSDEYDSIFIYGGDLSNLVGRLLYEQFVKCGQTKVVSMGTVLGTRGTLMNTNKLRGTCSIEVVNLNPKAKGFVEKLRANYTVKEVTI